MLSKDPEAMQPDVRRFVARAVTFQTCPECEGTRLTPEARSSRIRGLSIADLCRMQISDLAGWVGLGYLSLERPAGTLSGGEAQRTKMLRHLGQPLTTLSGGEGQRLKLATRMSEKASGYILDEPTAGLHLADVEHLLSLLDRLVDSGTSVIYLGG